MADPVDAAGDDGLGAVEDDVPPMRANRSLAAPGCGEKLIRILPEASLPAAACNIQEMSPCGTYQKVAEIGALAEAVDAGLRFPPEIEAAVLRAIEAGEIKEGDSISVAMFVHERHRAYLTGSFETHIRLGPAPGGVMLSATVPSFGTSQEEVLFVGVDGRRSYFA